MNTIQIIKLLRIAFCFGLVESKSIVDYYANKHMPGQPSGIGRVYTTQDVGAIMWIGARINSGQWTLEDGKLTTKVNVEADAYMEFVG